MADTTNQKLTGALAEVVKDIRAHGAGSVPPSEPEEFKARVRERAKKLRAEGVPHPENTARQQLLTEVWERREAEERRRTHENMPREDAGAWKRAAEEAVRRASRPRVQRLPNGKPVPGTSYNDLIQDEGRDRATEKLRAMALGGPAALREIQKAEQRERGLSPFEAAILAQLRGDD
ncbi:hypothetical protein [Streptomyces werraensis]|uniref:hypothetical protein n=1 Tax=Streptomyces werraensis TaxID=68284 RepID=UPI003817353F